MEAQRGQGSSDARGEHNDRPPVIGIGGSAGAVEALCAFFEAMPCALGAAIVVIQHLDPHHESALAALLGRHTTLSVRAASDATPVEANHVYVIPSDSALEICQGTLRCESACNFDPVFGVIGVQS